VKVLLTGATGFLGGHLVPRLLGRGLSVRAFARPTSRTAPLEAQGVEIVRGALTDDGDVAAAMDGVDAVVHAAGGGLALDPAVIHRANTETTRTLVRHATSLRRFVLVSSLAAHGPSRPGRPATEADPDAPRSEYGKSKLAAERALAALPCPWVVLRPPALYGEGEHRMEPLLRAARRGVVPTVYPAGTLSMLSGPDCAEAIAQALVQPEAAGVYYVAEPEPITRRAMAQAVGSQVGRRVLVVPLPPLVVRAAAALAEARARGGAPLVLTRDKVRDVLQPHQACDPGRALRELDWSPRDRFLAAASARNR